MNSVDLLSIRVVNRSFTIRLYEEPNYCWYREMSFPHKDWICPRFSVDIGYVSFVFEHY